MFCMKILLILPKFHEKTLTALEISKFSVQEEDILYTLTPLLIYGKSVQLRKTINEMGGNIPGGNVLGGIFPGGNFPRTNYLK